VTVGLLERANSRREMREQLIRSFARFFGRGDGQMNAACSFAQIEAQEFTAGFFLADHLTDAIGGRRVVDQMQRQRFAAHMEK